MILVNQTDRLIIKNTKMNCEHFIGRRKFIDGGGRSESRCMIIIDLQGNVKYSPVLLTEYGDLRRQALSYHSEGDSIL